MFQLQFFCGQIKTILNAVAMSHDFHFFYHFLPHDILPHGVYAIWLIRLVPRSEKQPTMISER